MHIVNWFKSYIFAKFVVFFIADDHSRVVLTELEGNPCSDYVNASYIDVSPFCAKIVNLSLNSWAFKYLSDLYHSLNSGEKQWRLLTLFFYF